YGLLDDVLDRGLVDDRQHLLRLRFRRREEAGAEACGGDHGLANGHRLPFVGCALNVSDGSDPRRSRTRLPRWRATMRQPTPTTVATSQPGRPSTEIVTTSTRTIAIDPSTAARVTPATAAHATAPASAASGSSTAAMPAIVATPLPPPNRRAT